VGDTFTRWLRCGKIPDAAWLMWLFGWPPPDGSFVVGEKLQKLRYERTPEAICAAAPIGYTSYQNAMADPARQQALARAIKTAGAGEEPSRIGAPDLHPETMRWVCSYAAAASLKACCARADDLLPTAYHAALAEADRLGVGTELREYLQNGPRWQGAGARLTGLVAANLFIPSEYMLKFRATACREMAAQHITTLTREVPLFREWFLDWAVTQVHKGRRIRLRGDTAASPAPGTPRRPGGRPTSAATQEVYRYCYDEYTRGTKRSQILEAARRRFGAHAPKHEHHVTLYARRYAKAHGLPLTRGSH
jgi:hypothetical protein